MIIRFLFPVKKNRILFWSYNFNQYACNPRYLSDYILKYHPDKFYIFWAFEQGFSSSDIDERIHVVKYPSIAYLIALYTSDFIVTNLRNDRFGTFFVKKKQQKYLMLWHGSTPLKKIEKDAQLELGKKYVYRAKDDSNMCDLMISNCDFFTEIIKRAFWYNGDILDKGLPRNDIFFDMSLKEKSVEKVREAYSLSFNECLVLYAPTFRNKDSSLKNYVIEWDKVISAIEDKVGKTVKVLLRLHPNLIGIDTSILLNNYKVLDATSYPDIQELLCAANFLITDYSSSMFDFSFFLGRPCFLYAKDIDNYDRGFYFNIHSLPFPIAFDSSQLVDNIISFNETEYKQAVEDFKVNIVGMHEEGEGCMSILKWMTKSCD